MGDVDGIIKGIEAVLAEYKNLPVLMDIDREFICIRCYRTVNRNEYKWYSVWKDAYFNQRCYLCGEKGGFTNVCRQNGKS